MAAARGALGGEYAKLFIYTLNHDGMLMTNSLFHYLSGLFRRSSGRRCGNFVSDVLLDRWSVIVERKFRSRRLKEF